jgi:hypothetical protein
MFQTNDPQAWQELLELIAKRVADDIMSSDGSDLAPVLRDTVEQTHITTPHYARHHLRSVQFRQTT